MAEKTEYIKRMNDLYIMTRYKYLLQQKTGEGYTTLTKPKLHDGLVQAHLEQKLTLGIFSGKTLAKFMCFDIDMNEQSEFMAFTLIDTLVNRYGFDYSDILVSFSGSKGIHIELFFDKALRVDDLQKFYRLVLLDVEASENEVEFRSTNKQGVKLPLSINRKTGKKCYLMDSKTLDPVDDTELFKVQKIDTELFLEQLEDVWTDEAITGTQSASDNEPMTLDTDKAEEFEEVISELNTALQVDYLQRIKRMLTEGTLIYPNSRHNSTMILSVFYNQQGYLPEDTESFIYSLMHKTWTTKRHYFSHDTTLEYIRSEIKRLTALTYEKDYKLNSRRKYVEIYKEDIYYTLDPKRIHLRKLLFSMIVHSKRYAVTDQSFYMTYKQMAEMGNTTDRGRLSKYTEQLQEAGLIEILRKNERKEKSYLSKPNVYRLKDIAYADNSTALQLKEVDANDFEQTVTELLSEQELKQLVSKKQFYNTFKQFYER